MIQYSTVTDDQSRRRSVLDTRLRGYDTERDEGAPHLFPLWERSDRVVRCDPGEGLRCIDGPGPLTPTLSHRGRGS